VFVHNSKETNVFTLLSKRGKETDKLESVTFAGVMENLEKSWNFKMVISRTGKVL